MDPRLPAQPWLEQPLTTTLSLALTFRFTETLLADYSRQMWPRMLRAPSETGAGQLGHGQTRIPAHPSCSGRWLWRCQLCRFPQLLLFSLQCGFTKCSWSLEEILLFTLLYLQQCHKKASLSLPFNLFGLLTAQSLSAGASLNFLPHGSPF